MRSNPDNHNADEMIPAAPDPEMVKAAMALLPRIPKVWDGVPELSHLDEKALGLLVACGLVERRLTLRLRCAGDERAVLVSFRFTGQEGLAQALEPPLAEACALWAEAWKTGRKVYTELSNGQGQWRLTDCGEDAVQEIARGDMEYLQDVLRTPPKPHALALPRPLKFMPGLHRPVIDGDGHLERVEIVNADSAPLSVEVVNLGEMSGPLGDIARQINRILQHLIDQAAAADANGAGETQTAGSVSRCQDVQNCLLGMMNRNERYTSERDLAERLGCSKATVHKAIMGSRALQYWREGHRGGGTPKAQSLHGVVLDSTPGKGSDPAEAAAENERLDRELRRLLEEATDEERASMNSLSPEEQKELARTVLESKKDQDTQDRGDGGMRDLGRKP